MENFRCLGTGLDIAPLREALVRHAALWDILPIRTRTPGSPHAAASDILVRFADLRGVSAKDAVWRVFEGLDSVDYPARALLPEADTLTQWLVQATGQALVGRLLITRLAPGRHITAHWDEGAYARAHDRYHICLAGDGGNLFRCGDEIVNMRPGDAWWFQTAIEHEVWNAGACDRLTLIVDLRRETPYVA